MSQRIDMSYCLLVCDKKLDLESLCQMFYRTFRSDKKIILLIMFVCKGFEVMYVYSIIILLQYLPVLESF